MAATRSFAIPRCSRHEIPCRRDDAGQWFCVECVDEVLNQRATQLILPAGVKARSILEIVPNRRMRRAHRGA